MLPKRTTLSPWNRTADTATPRHCPEAFHRGAVQDQIGRYAARGHRVTVDGDTVRQCGAGHSQWGLADTGP